MYEVIFYKPNNVTHRKQFTNWHRAITWMYNNQNYSDATHWELRRIQ